MEQTFFSASTIEWYLSDARCNPLRAWFLFQNDANLYLTLPEHGNGKRLQYNDTHSIIVTDKLSNDLSYLDPLISHT